MAFPGRFYRDGGLLKQENVAGNLRLFFVEQFGFNHFFNDEIFKWIDALADSGVNGMRVFGFWPFGNGQEEEPYIRTGAIYDLNQFNDRFFEYQQKWVAYAEECGIAVLYELFDTCGITQASVAPHHPFYQLVGGSANAFADVNNTALLDIQKCYVAKVIETLRKRRNVLLGVMNEYNDDKRWHFEMSRYVRLLWPDALISGSEENSPAAADPNVDMWFIHTGRYNLATGESDVSADVRAMRAKTRSDTLIGFSTDGFGKSGLERENPDDMRRLAQDVNRAGLQLFGFLDHRAYLPERGDSSAAQLNLAVYQAIVEEFQPYPVPPVTPKPKFRFDDDSYKSFARKGVPADVITRLRPLNGQEYVAKEELLDAIRLIIGRPQADHYADVFAKYTVIGRPVEGFLDIFRVAALPSTHPGAFSERSGKAIRATTQQGFLCYGQYKKGYPVKPLKALFSVQIDNNTADDRNILILDVYDHHSDRVIGKEVITRKDFPNANQFCLFSFDFTPPSADANMEFRMYYMGYSYVLADKIAVIDPTDAQITDAAQIPDFVPSFGEEPPVIAGGGEIFGELVIHDPLTNGRTVGVVNGGAFTPGGYNITTNFYGSLVYETGITGNIGVEFDAKGYIDREECSDSKLVVLLMYDAPRDANLGDPAIWRESSYSVLEMRKRGHVAGFEHVTNGLGLKCGAHGDGLEFGTWAGHGLAGHPLEWNPEVTYHWVVTWKNGALEILRNKQPMYAVNTLPQYEPKGRMVVRIGGTHWGRSGPRGVTYSNVRIYRV